METETLDARPRVASRRRAALVGSLCAIVVVAAGRRATSGAAAAASLARRHRHDDGAVAAAAPGSHNLTVESVRVQSATGLSLSLRVRLSTDARVRAQWGAPGTVLLQSAWSLAASEHELALYRVRPCTEYKVSLFASGAGDSDDDAGSLQRELSVTSACTGLPRFDGGPLATVRGNATYDVLVTDHSEAGFHGFVGLDSDGWVVWYYNYTRMQFLSDGDVPAHAYDQVPDGSFSAVLLTQGTEQLQQVAADGTLMLAHAGPELTTCGGALTHEAVVNTYSDDLADVLTLQDHIVWLEGRDQAQLAQSLVRWDRSADRLTTMFNLSDHFDVVKDRGAMSDDDWTFQCKDLNGDTVTAEDWLHANSVVATAKGEYLVSLRSLSALVAISEVGGVRWTLSSEVRSDFAFVNDGQKFYNQHHATYLAETGHIMLVDNGDSRGSAAGLWSRAAEYALNFTDYTVELVWEFRPGLYTQAQGSLYALENQNRIAHFPYVETPHYEMRFHQHIYEVSPRPSAEVIANITIPWNGISVLHCPSRVKPIKSLAGEHAANLVVR